MLPSRRVGSDDNSAFSSYADLLILRQRAQMRKNAWV